MKQRLLIFLGNPCTTRLDDPTIQTVSDAQARGPAPCRYDSDRIRCSPPRFGCVQVAGLKVAQYVLEFYSEATEKTLAMEVEEFRRRAPLPPERLEAYIDTPDYDYRHITDPELVVQRVTDYARKVLDLKPGELILRSPEDPHLSPYSWK